MEKETTWNIPRRWRRRSRETFNNFRRCILTCNPMNLNIYLYLGILLPKLSLWTLLKSWSISLEDVKKTFIFSVHECRASSRSRLSPKMSTTVVSRRPWTRSWRLESRWPAPIVLAHGDPVLQESGDSLPGTPRYVSRSAVRTSRATRDARSLVSWTQEFAKIVNETDGELSTTTESEPLEIASIRAYVTFTACNVLVCLTTRATLLTRNRRGGGNVIPDNQPENRTLVTAQTSSALILHEPEERRSLCKSRECANAKRIQD